MVSVLNPHGILDITPHTVNTRVIHLGFLLGREAGRRWLEAVIGGRAALCNPTAVSEGLASQQRILEPVLMDTRETYPFNALGPSRFDLCDTRQMTDSQTDRRLQRDGTQDPSPN